MEHSRTTVNFLEANSILLYIMKPQEHCVKSR